MNFISYLKNRFNGDVIIRISDDVAFIYKIRAKYVCFVNCCRAWSKAGDYSKELEFYLKKYNYNTKETDILMDNTFKEMMDSLKADYKLVEFEKSNRQFPDALFEPKKIEH